MSTQTGASTKNATGKIHAQELQKKVLFEFKCMKYVEFCKFRLSHPGKLKTKVDLNVLCIFSYVAFWALVWYENNILKCVVHSPEV